jgi:dihydrodipicolinate synthase/N-acetylneuraminate lyase
VRKAAVMEATALARLAAWPNVTAALVPVPYFTRPKPAGVLAHFTHLAAAVFAEPNPTVIKGVLHAQGRIPTPNVRLPLLPAGQDAVDQALKQLADLQV